jgi:hypothetical protein
MVQEPGVLLSPGYWIAERIPSIREAARRLGLVTLAQMLAALVLAVEEPARGVRILEVPDLRAAKISPVSTASARIGSSPR